MFLSVAVLEARQPEHAPLQPEHDARGPPSDTTPPRLVPPPGAPISPRGHQFRLVAPPAAPATVATLEPGDWNRLEWLRGRGAQQQKWTAATPDEARQDGAPKHNTQSPTSNLTPPLYSSSSYSGAAS